MRSSVTVPEAKMNVLMSQLFGGTRTEVDGQHQRGGKVVKNPPANAGDAGNADLIPALGRSPGVENGNPTAVFLPGESHGQSSLVAYSPWGPKESDTTEVT